METPSALPANKRIIAMNEESTGFDLNEEIFFYEVSDEALEAAACAGQENAKAFTIAFCTGSAECPF